MLIPNFNQFFKKSKIDFLLKEIFNVMFKLKNNTLATNYGDEN
jgi:hypothetical protein